MQGTGDEYVVRCRIKKLITLRYMLDVGWVEFLRNPALSVTTLSRNQSRPPGFRKTLPTLDQTFIHS